MTSSATRRVSGWWWVAVVLTALKLWLTRGQPVFALGEAGHDDRLFVQLADHLLHGRWLGPYDQMTLAKGPFFSMWIAAAHFFHVPLFLSQQLLYAGSCAALVWACRPALRSQWIRLGFYLLLLWNPISFEASSLGRVLRQNVYSPLTLLILAGIAALYFRREESSRRHAPWAALLGLSFAGFWLTREESVWIMPGFGLLTGAVLIGSWRSSRDALRRAVLALGLAASCAALPVLLVCAMNYRYYGWFGTVEFRSTEFNDAYGAMVRVRAGPDLPFVPVTREAREAMYAVSPTFAQLRPQLEGDIGLGWADASSPVTGLPAAQREIGGGWLMWALRDAVTAAGHAHNARDALAFYRGMADEINRACDDGRLHGGARRSGFLPRWRSGQGEEIGRTFLRFASFVISYENFSAIAPPSSGSDESLEFFRRVTRDRLSTPENVPAPGPSDQRAVLLDSVGKILGRMLCVLFVLAQGVAVVRTWQSATRRELTYPFLLAAAVWGAGAIYLLIQAIIQVTSFPVLVISSFGPVYPLLPVFIFAVAWDAQLAWQTRRVERSNVSKDPAKIIPETMPPSALPLNAGLARALPWVGVVAALAPFVFWHRLFAELFWFGDDYFLVDQLAQMGFWKWTWVPFTESFAPLFKALWGGTLVLSGGSYRAMLAVLWLTHAANAFLLGRLLLRAGFPWIATIVTQLVFTLLPANLETLGWSVQWSAVLATTFLLLGLLCEMQRIGSPATATWRTTALQAVMVAASACSFARGVLTGAVLALARLWPAPMNFDWKEALRRAPAALLCLAPAVAVIVVIKVYTVGNHQQMNGHWLDAIGFGLTFYFANPGYLIGGGPDWSPLVIVAVFGAVKLVLTWWGLRYAKGAAHTLLVLLLAYDLGNAVILGIGRYHTGFQGALGYRYYYGSLLATLPFAGLWLDWLVGKLPAVGRWRSIAAGAALVGLAAYCLHGWPIELRSFTSWRGTDVRHLMQAPTTSDPAARVPGLDIMHVERAKALIRAYDLH